MSGTAIPDPTLDWDEDDDPNEPESPEWAALLGFDPVVDPARYQALLAQDADWDEDEHKRGQPGNAGQFGSGGGVPEPKSYLGGSGKKAHSIAQKAISGGGDPKQAATAIKSLIASLAHPNHAKYGNQLLAHLEAYFKLHPGELGKALPKGSAEPAGPASAPPAAPPAAAKPAGMAAPKKGESGPPTTPLGIPEPVTNLEKLIVSVATGPGSDADKVEKINKTSAGWSPLPIYHRHQEPYDGAGISRRLHRQIRGRMDHSPRRRSWHARAGHTDPCSVPDRDAQAAEAQV
jgi:hypothetical protein